MAAWTRPKATTASAVQGFRPSWLLGHCTSANKSPKGIQTKRNITQQGSAVWPDQPHCMTQQSKGKCSPWLSGPCGRGDTTPLPQEPKGTIITCNSNKPHRSFSCSVVRLVNKQPVYCPFYDIPVASTCYLCSGAPKLNHIFYVILFFLFLREVVSQWSHQRASRLTFENGPGYSGNSNNKSNKLQKSRTITVVTNNLGELQLQHHKHSSATRTA